MAKIQTLRGFRDISGEEIERFRIIEQVSRKYFDLLGLAEIEVPVLERTELFVRSIGDTTDIVEKEMFTFTDLGGDSVTLRPEATAGVVRAYLQAGLYAKERVSKLFTMGPMFRHEKPQKGRFRQFRQIDVEVFGSSDSLIDADLLWMISLILGDLKIANYSIEVNSVGCPRCREDFRGKVISYFETKKDELCGDCLRRLYRNPLRIFDCKHEHCIEVSRQSPFLFDSLCDSCKDHFDAFLTHLNEFGVVVTVNKRLVRGLDYYTKTVFEFTSGDLGAQRAFIAGGRYDNLVEEMGGPKTPGTGFAIGMERLAMLSGATIAMRDPVYYFAYVGEKAKKFVIPVLRAFADNGLSLRYDYEGKSLKSQMRYADSLKADFVLILGDDEINRGVVTLRNMKTKAQREIPLDPSRMPVEVTKLV
ncbi:MAG: histidine--tRNA ligase [Syntrophobacterales bacterium]|jgi:histidyl-tRNA synthetase|nr:histidine--tRNA ligase [Syntrophobacterales bacterium]